MHWIDPASLPVMTGTLLRLVVNDHGHLDGMIIRRARKAPLLVHMPPHLGRAVAKAFKPGDRVEVRGVKPRNADMLVAVAFRTAAGQEIVDLGPGEHGPPKPLKSKAIEGDVEGVVQVSLYAPKGELHGAVLEDGTVLRIGPKEAGTFGELLVPGALVGARGHGIATTYGRSFKVEMIGRDLANLRPVKQGKPKPRR